MLRVERVFSKIGKKNLMLNIAQSLEKSVAAWWNFRTILKADRWHGKKKSLKLF